MAGFIDFLRTLFVRTPYEILVALLRLLFMLVLFFIVLFLKILEWLWELLLKKRKTLYPESKSKPCNRLPEAIIRRPDPCIYSQAYLRSLGLPVTWNNPDMWVARADDPTSIEPDSFHMVEDTDYIVTVQVHNNSTDPAIGVRVRAFFHPWAFNWWSGVTGDYPMETDAAGNEVMRFVHVPPMGSTITQFRWHTPEIQDDMPYQNFCLKAFLYHPMDQNPNNNYGRENARVWSANPGNVSPGETLAFEVPLFNPAPKPQRFRFVADLYEIDTKEKFSLALETIRGYSRMKPSQVVANFLPTLHARKPEQELGTGRLGLGMFDFQAKPRLRLVKTRYKGFGQIKKSITGRDYSIPPQMNITADGELLTKGILVKSKETHPVKFNVKIPEHAPSGSRYPLNINAYSESGSLMGGVTIIFDVK